MNFSIFRDYINTNMKKGNWVYRGQSNPLWELTSSYSRFFDNINIEKNKFSLDIFNSMLKKFLNHLSEYETKNLHNMKLHQKIALAQHYGLPTPFLDWTYSPYIAVYFAVSDKIYFSNQEISFKIWALNIENFEEDELSDTDFTKILLNEDFKFITANNFYSRRISRQSGCFTFLNFNGDFYARIKSKNDAINLNQFTVSGNRLDIINELELMGINGCNLFDDIDYISKDVIFNTINAINNNNI